jgi:hypothetical protein
MPTFSSMVLALSSLCIKRATSRVRRPTLSCLIDACQHEVRRIQSLDAVKFVKEYILSAPDVLSDVTKSIEGWGWDHTVWPGNAWPTAVGATQSHFYSPLTMLQADFDEDSVLRGRRIVLQSKDGHALWVSSSVIEAMGSIPADIEGGVYTRTDSGHPAGQQASTPVFQRIFDRTLPCRRVHRQGAGLRP